MAQYIFVFSGEGTRAPDTDFSLLPLSPAWDQCVAAAISLGIDLAAVFADEEQRATHAAPLSPVLTTVVNVCYAALWRLWGFSPKIAVGHSLGELGAAYAAGLIDAHGAVLAAYALGRAASAAAGRGLAGGLVATEVPSHEVEALRLGHDADGLALAAVNADNGTTAQVTLCGPHDAVARRCEADPSAKKLHAGHPWHHPAFAFGGEVNAVASACGGHASPAGAACGFVSAAACNGDDASAARLDAAHWRRWLSTPVDFCGALSRVATRARGTGADVVVIEIGAHPQFGTAVAGTLAPVAHATSLCRGAPAKSFVLEQRAELIASLSARGVTSPLAAALEEAAPRHPKGGAAPLSLDVPLGNQGVTSQQFVQLCHTMQAWFPGVQPHDLYRLTSLGALAARFGATSSGGPAPLADAPAPLATSSAGASAAAAVVGISLRLPGGIDTCDGLWSALEAPPPSPDAPVIGGGMLGSATFDATREATRRARTRHGAAERGRGASLTSNQD